MDFGALPPETNSALMYAGRGSAPLLAAAAAWHGLATELTTIASAYESVTSRLSSESWLGPASLAMMATTQPFVAWLAYTSECSALAASQAQASAAAFESALAMMVPPAEIAANRAQLAALVASDGLGQNGPAIAANEARYLQMWAQDADTMYRYAASSALACRLNPLTAPSPVTGTAESAAAESALLAGLNSVVAHGPEAVLNLASPGLAAAPAAGPDTLGLFSVFDSAEIPMYDVFHHMRAVEADWVTNLCADWAPGDAEDDATDAASHTAPGSAAATVAHSPARTAGPVLRAGLGNATSVGRLSVPEGWSTTAPALPAATVAAGTGWAVPAEEESVTAIPGTPGLPGAGYEARVGATPRYGFKPVVMPNRGW